MTASVVPAAVTLRPGGPREHDDLVSAVVDATPTSLDSALELARELGKRDAIPGRGATRELWEAFSTSAAIDLGAVRAIEPHLDAVAILTQAGRTDLIGDQLWGVYAAEAPDAILIESDGLLSGTKAWCSLAGRVDSALVTAQTRTGDRGLFAVDLHHPGVKVVEGAWHSRGLAEIPSGPVIFSDVPGIPVGVGDWYLTRPGFSWGGIGVAACWFGGAVGIARTVHASATRRSGDTILLMHLGAIDELLNTARRALNESAALIDAGEATGAPGRLLAKRVRATVARVCDEVIDRAGHALGPAPLALDEAHAKRVADLTVYVRQQHAEKDAVSLGETLARTETAPW